MNGIKTEHKPKSDPTGQHRFENVARIMRLHFQVKSEIAKCKGTQQWQLTVWFIHIYGCKTSCWLKTSSICMTIFPVFLTLALHFLMSFNTPVIVDWETVMVMTESYVGCLSLFCNPWQQQVVVFIHIFIGFIFSPIFSLCSDFVTNIFCVIWKALELNVLCWFQKFSDCLWVLIINENVLNSTHTEVFFFSCGGLWNRNPLWLDWSFLPSYLVLQPDMTGMIDVHIRPLSLVTLLVVKKQR